MSPSRALLFLTVVAPLALFAAPVPESVSHGKAFKNTFGTAHTPDESSFRFDGTTLRTQFPKGWTGNYYNDRPGPRTEQSVTGDFDVTVAVRTTAPVDPPRGKKGGTRCDLGGGLAVWEADGKDPTTAAKDENGRTKAVSVCRYYAFRGEPRKGEPRCWDFGDVANYPGVMYHGDDEGGDPTETTHLRVTRRGNLITTAKSTDGETWKTIATQPPVDLPATVRVGVWAFEGTNHGYEVTFEKFTVTPK